MNELDNKYDVYGSYHSKKPDIFPDKTFKLDVSQEKNIQNILKIVEPDLVISCLRGDFLMQLKVHKDLANYLQKTRGKLYFCSTANVFDGNTSKAHYEHDDTGAKSDYGQYKIVSASINGKEVNRDLFSPKEDSLLIPKKEFIRLCGKEVNEISVLLGA